MNPQDGFSDVIVFESTLTFPKEYLLLSNESFKVIKTLVTQPLTSVSGLYKEQYESCHGPTTVFGNHLLTIDNSSCSGNGRSLFR